ncbi:MAG: arsenite-transporting ATPase ArsA [Bacteroidetes bacterium HLUCCA01]|nr:MAG: arsenite-transporting ATPase ArsA [Bacteroidetes bacterium HLUCCA01]
MQSHPGSDSTQYVFFSGKGGVGKSSMAAARAVYEADRGRRTLLVSTDPAGNLGDIFEVPISTDTVTVSPNLQVIQLDADKITDAYKRKMLAPLEEILDELAMESVREQFNGGCTVEIATFDRFTDFLSNTGYDVVVFDTAPTGHTLRLMTLPGEWSDYITKSEQGSGQTCIGPVSQIQESKKKYDAAVQVLRDPQRSTMFLVARPEKTSVFETLRAKAELEKTGITHFELIVNGVFPSDEAGTIFAEQRKNQQRYIETLQESTLPLIQVAMQLGEIKGVETLTRFGNMVFGGQSARVSVRHEETQPFQGFAGPAELDRLLNRAGNRRILAFTGKGGVGKTVAACAMAMETGTRGKTLLITTDPAAHIGQVLDTDVGHLPREISTGVWAANIDQRLAAEAYKTQILDDAKSNGYSDDVLASIQEELESPCTEEIAIFEHFSKYINDPQWEYIVLDTAPTGHTLRLLELPFDYQKQIQMKAQDHPDDASGQSQKQNLETVIEQMKNPAITTFFLVAYPEFTPLHESRRAADDLARVGIQVQGVLLNHVLNRDDCDGEFASARYAMQQYYLHEAAGLFDVPLFAVPLRSTEITGIDQVNALRYSLLPQILNA